MPTLALIGMVSFGSVGVFFHCTVPPMSWMLAPMENFFQGQSQNFLVYSTQDVLRGPVAEVDLVLDIGGDHPADD